MVSSMARFEPERSATHHVRNRRERAARAELDRGAKRIADSQPHERAAASIITALHRPVLRQQDPRLPQPLRSLVHADHGAFSRT
jgi:hypothetical protein